MELEGEFVHCRANLFFGGKTKRDFLRGGEKVIRCIYYEDSMKNESQNNIPSTNLSLLIEENNKIINEKAVQDWLGMKL